MGELLIKNGRTIQNKNIDIYIKNNKILKIGEYLKVSQDVTVIDLMNRYYISPGWIDIHTHCYPKANIYFDDADEIGYKTGVTTVVDAGSCGYNQIEDFYTITRNKITNVYCFINIADTGISRQDELSDLKRIKTSHIQKAIETFPDFIVGIKARMSASVIGDNGIIPLQKAVDIKNEIGKPLMVHCGSYPPTIEEIVNLLGADCILTHCFHGKPNGLFNKNNQIKSEILQAIYRGMYLDVGHGKESFSFSIAQKALRQGLKADTISSDIYQYNRSNGPVYDLATTLNKMLSIGYSLEEVINKVTKAPSIFLQLNKGQIKEGFDGEFTIFTLENKKQILRDSMSKEIKINQRIVPYGVILQQKLIKIDKEV